MTDVLKLDFNERSDKANPLTKEFGFGDSLWLYPEREPLERQIAELNQIEPNQVLCTNGGDEAIMILMRLIKEGKKLILPLPAFSQYTWGVESWQQDVVLVEAKKNLAIDIAETIRQIENTSNTVTILTRPNNPTGEAIEFSELVSTIETAKKNSGWVFLDEAYIEFSDFDSAADTLLSQYDNLVILRTLSKAYGLAGIRLGYLLGSQALIESFRIRCMPFNIPSPSLQIAKRALQTGSQQEMREYCQQVKANRNELVEWLQQNNFQVFSSQANFIMIKLPPHMAVAIQSFLAKNDILIRTFKEKALADCVRISIPTNLEPLLGKLKQCLTPELVCMDMDGVLIDTSGSYDQTVLATVKKISGKDVTLEALESLRRQGGFNNDWVLSRKLLENLGVNRSLDEVTDIFQRLYLGENNDGLVSNETPIINESMSFAIKESSAVFTVVTGRPRKEARSGQALTNLSTLDLVSLDDVKEGKPSPEGIQSLQQKYSDLSWMCGDNPDDMQAATRSNSLAIGIGENKVDALYEAGADIVLKNINELEKWICR